MSFNYNSGIAGLQGCACMYTECSQIMNFLGVQEYPNHLIVDDIIGWLKTMKQLETRWMTGRMLLQELIEWEYIF